MAYKTADLKKKALEAIEEHGLFFIEDVVAYLPCSKPTFYEHGLNEINELKEALERNKVVKKVALRKNWDDPKAAPVLQLALYRLICDKDEFDKLNLQRIDHTSKGESMQPINIVVNTQKNGDELKKFIKDVSKTD